MVHNLTVASYMYFHKDNCRTFLILNVKKKLSLAPPFYALHAFHTQSFEHVTGAQNSKEMSVIELEIYI